MIKKLTLGSVVAAACLTSSVYAQSLEEAFANGKFKGEVRSYYFQEDYKSTGRSSILHYGGFLSYETDKYNGLTAGATLQTSSVGDINNTNKFAADEDASGAVLSEAFLTYGLENTTVKVGRQYIGTPMVAGSGSRMIKQAFEGVTLTNTDIPDTKVMGIYVNKYQKRTDGNGDVGEFSKDFDTNSNGSVTLEDGAYSIYLQNKSIDNLAIQAQYLDAVDSFTTLYVDSVYNLGTDYNLSVMGQYLSTSYDSNAQDGEYLSAKIGGSYNGYNLSVSASENTSDGAVESGLGYGADWSLVSGVIEWGWRAYTANAKAYQVNVSKKVFDVGVNLIYSTVELANGNDVDETDFIFDYEIMKNLDLHVVHAEFDGIDKNYESRVQLSYKF